MELRVLALFAAALIGGYAVTGPVYTAFGFNGDAAVESAGVMLNQMARVVALDGDMSAEDEAYMADLFPLERYESTYTPCLVNTLKRDADEHPEYGATEPFGISVQSKLPVQARDFLPIDEWSIPAGWILWLMIFAAICLVGARKTRWMVLLVPGAALLATLVIASPIVYWPRYALACQLALPVYLGLLWRIRCRRTS